MLLIALNASAQTVLAPQAFHALQVMRAPVLQSLVSELQPVKNDGRCCWHAVGQSCAESARALVEKEVELLNLSGAIQQGLLCYLQSTLEEHEGSASVAAETCSTFVDVARSS